MFERAILKITKPSSILFFAEVSACPQKDFVVMYTPQQFSKTLLERSIDTKCSMFSELTTSFVGKHSFAGKKVALFFTLDNNPRGAVEKTKKLMSGAYFVGELVLVKPTQDKEAAKKKIGEWCGTLKAKLQI